MPDSKKEHKLPETDTTNLDLWKKVCQTKPGYTKPVEYGKRKFTAIDAHYQLMNATAEWGPYGKSWGVKNLTWTVTQLPDIGTNLALDADFYYPDGGKEIVFPISVDMPFKNNDDCRKKLLTEARSKSLSHLGFNADIFFGQWDDSRYVSEMGVKFGEQDKLRNVALAKIRTAKTLEALVEHQSTADRYVADTLIDGTLYAELEAAIKARRKQLESSGKKPGRRVDKPLSDAEKEAQLAEQFEQDNK